MKTAAARIHYPIDRLALILISCVVLSAAWNIAAAEWMPRLDLLGETAIVAIVLGTLIASRSWRTSIAHLVMVAYGVIWVTLVVLDQMPDKVYGWSGLDTLRHMIVRLGEHIYIWGQAVTTGGVGTDNSIFLLFLTALFWLIAYIAVWNTFRQQHIWRAVAPAGVALLINTYYYGGPQSLFLLLIVYIFCVLLYAARMYTLNQEQRWQFSRVRFNPEIKRDFLQIGSGIALAAVLFGAVAPTVLGAPQFGDLWRQVSRPVRSVEESFNRLFSGLQPHGMAFANPFGRTLALLGQRNLGSELVMEVKSSEGNYWQAVAYDEYTGTAFQSSDTTRLAVDQNEPFAEQFDQRVFVTQTFTVYFPNNTLIFAAPQPRSVDRAAWVETLPAETTPDVTMWTTINPLGAGDSYQVVSASSQATIEQLRKSSIDYATSIRQRYLQLPASLPDRVRQLARRIVTEAKATTPFDQASALEQWLRNNIKYNEKIAPPPPGTDGVDYVLFEVKEGYCDYYASAMAVMARSLGIPARIVTGYASGTLDADRGVYQVYQYNAHTWVEVYFPKYGWIQFEPTASLPAITRPSPAVANATGKDPNADLSAQEKAAQSQENQRPEDIDSLRNRGPLNLSGLPANSNNDQLIWVLIVASVVMLLVAGSFIALWVYENHGSQRNQPGGEWAFMRLARLAHWLRVKLMPWQTPFEQAQALSEVLPRNEPAFEKVAGLYVQERYGRTPADREEVQTIWRTLRPTLWWTGLKRRIPRVLPSPAKLLRRRKSARVLSKEVDGG